MVGMTGFEPATSPFQTARSRLAELHPESLNLQHRTPRAVVELSGFEPKVSASRTQRDTKLRYSSLWAQHQESNLTNSPYEGGALPACSTGVVEALGFEP